MGKTQTELRVIARVRKEKGTLLRNIEVKKQDIEYFELKIKACDDFINRMEN